jgi:hypothetical protein
MKTYEHGFMTSNLFLREPPLSAEKNVRPKKQVICAAGTQSNNAQHG